MTEMTKTSLFFALALGAIALAVLTRPSASDFDVDEMRGQMLFSDTTFEGDKAKRLRITTVNEESGDRRVFEVNQADGIWTIPSKSNYPADATQQMGEAVEGLTGKEILTIESSNSGSHAQFGVVDPTDTSAATGHGTRVQLFDEKDKPLADLIIGKQDKDGNRYVRRGGQDQVFLVNVDEESFSTDFRDWIEKDLLQFSPFDVAEVAIDDYAIAIVNTPQGPRFSLDPRVKMELQFDDMSSEWSPKRLEEFDRRTGEYKPFELKENQQLNAETLRELKNALDDLVIVDVERKPQGLSADLQAGEEFMNNDEAKLSLYERGFYPLTTEEGIRLLSGEGEIVVTLKTGVEYVLRFGDLQLDLMGDGAEPQKDGEQGADDAEGVNRYLFVMARLNEGMIEKPMLEPLPELPAEEATEADAPEDAAAATEGEEGAASDEATPDEGATEAGEGEDSAEGEADKPKDDAAAKARAEIEQQRKIVEEANKKREAGYQKKLDEGRKRVEQLNARFGDWYYVIPNDVFKKIHLGREQLVTDKPKEDRGAAGGGPAIPGISLPDLGLDADVPAGEPATEGPEGEAADGEMSDEAAGEEATEEVPADEPGDEAAAPEGEGGEPAEGGSTPPEA